MADEEDRLDRLKRGAFGRLADEAKVTSVGSGLSQTTSIAVDLVTHADGRELKQPAWSETPAMIEQLFTPIFQRTGICPGRDQPQCCQASPGKACFPNWQAREDPEWYALEINKCLVMVNQRLKSVTPIGAALAADEAFELGCLFTEALLKFRWDRFAKSGLGSTRGGKRGGDQKKSQLRRQFTPLSTFDAVNALVAKGVGQMQAYLLVGKGQGASAATIRKEYGNYKKMLAPRG